MHREVFPKEKRIPKAVEHEHFLFEGIAYPASKQDLVELATDGEADTDTDTLNLIRSLPDREYRSRDDIWRSIGEATRVFVGGSGTGSPRDDIGKEAVFSGAGLLHP